jgi:large repetitive protein
VTVTGNALANLGSLTIENGASLTVNSSTSNLDITNLTLNANLTDNSGGVDVSSDLNWTGGTLTTSTASDIASGATASMTGNVVLDSELDIDGQASVGVLNAANGSTLAMGSSGLVNILSDGTLTIYGQGDGTNVLNTNSGFINGGLVIQSGGGAIEIAGTLVADSGSGEMIIGVPVTNEATGTINVESGFLDIANGGSSAGMIEIASGTTLQFERNVAFSFASGSEVTETGTGSLVFNNNAAVTVDGNALANLGSLTIENGASLTVNSSTSNLDITNLTLNANLTDNSGGVDVSGNWSWTGGTLTTSTASDILSGATASMTGNVVLDSELDIDGQASVGVLNGANGSTLEMGLSGFVHVLSDGTLTIYGQGGGTSVTDNGGGSLTIDGTLIGDSGSGAMTVSVPVTNETGGVIDAQSGALDLTGGLTNNGTLETTGGTVDVTAAVSGTGSVSISGGGTAEFGGSFDQNVTFGSGGGTLILAQPGSFDTSHVIAAASGSFLGNDILDLIGYATADTASTAGGFNSATDTTTLTIYNSGQDVVQTFTLAGNQSGATWTVNANASHNGIDVYDPPPTPPVDTSGESSITLSDGNGNSPIQIDPGAPIVIEAGGGVVIEAASSQNVTFTGGTGTLDLAQPSSFTGEIAGFTGSAPDATHSDVIDLAGINYNSGSFSENYNSATGVLTVSDGTDSAPLMFVDFTGTFKFASDGDGGTDIYDPPGTSSSGPSVSVGGAGNDTFIFQPGMGAETINNFNAKTDSIELDGLSNIHSLHQLASQIATDAQGDTVIELGHHDSVSLPGVTTSYLQAHLSSLVHLH